MDAPIFPARPHAEPATLTISRTKGSGAVDAAAAPVQCGTRRQARTGKREVFFRARRVAGGCGSAVAFGPRGHLLALRGNGTHGHSTQPRGGAQHRLYPDASGTPSEEHGDLLGHTPRDSGLRLPWRGFAVDAAAGAPDASPAGNRKDRFAGGARFLSSLHRGRTFVAHHRAPARTGGAAG